LIYTNIIKKVYKFLRNFQNQLIILFKIQLILDSI
jgi:hypothetical protein